MSAIDRVRSVSWDRLTERQARFLVTVMEHSGVCLPRQYAAFAGIVYGQKTWDFFDRLVRRKFAVAYSCRHHRGRIYHVRYKPFYRAIGDTDSRFRRSMSAAQVVDRLATLDGVISTPNVTWLALAPQFNWLSKRYDEVFRQQLASPVPDLVNHLRWYFKKRQLASTGQGAV